MLFSLLQTPFLYFFLMENFHQVFISYKQDASFGKKLFGFAGNKPSEKD